MLQCWIIPLAIQSEFCVCIYIILYYITIIQKTNLEYWILDIQFAECCFLNFNHAYHFFFLSQNQSCPHRPALTPVFQTLSTLCWAWCVASVFCCLSSGGLSVYTTGLLTVGFGMLTIFHLLCKHSVDLIPNLLQIEWS